MRVFPSPTRIQSLLVGSRLGRSGGVFGKAATEAFPIKCHDMSGLLLNRSVQPHRD